MALQHKVEIIAPHTENMADMGREEVNAVAPKCDLMISVVQKVCWC